MASDSAQSIKLRLTAVQRQALATALPQFADRLQADVGGQRTIAFTLKEAEVIENATKGNKVNARDGTKRNTLELIQQTTLRAIENAKGIGAIPGSERLYQFKVTIRDIEPPIWRRIQTRNCTLERLHETIQLAFGWQNCHLHRFMIGEREYADPFLMEDDLEEFDMLNSRKTKLSKILPASGKRFTFDYEYDFGDSWIHEVLFEGCLKMKPGMRYPFCVEGARACPPEDVGGSMGYAEYVEIMADPRHREHRRMLKWGGSFDPEAFDAGKANLDLRFGMSRPVDY